MAASAVKIQKRIEAELENTPFRVEPGSLHALSGGTANFIYKASLAQPLEDGTVQVAVKHGESFLASNEEFKLPVSRCVRIPLPFRHPFVLRFSSHTRCHSLTTQPPIHPQLIEEQCLQSLGDLTPSTTPLFSVRTPRMIYFNPETSTQVQEYQPDAKSLKDYVISRAGRDESDQPRYTELGRSLGGWLRSFHHWANDPERPELRDTVQGNGDMQKIKHWANYQRLADVRAKYLDALAGREAAFDAVIELTAAELSDQSALQVIHGDFWTGNILLRDEPLQAQPGSPVFVVDWEMCQLSLPALDIGQMAAELYQLVIYKGHSAGAWVLEGLMEGYGPVNDGFFLRAALHVGAHLVSFGTTVEGWGDKDKVEEVARLGGEIIERAWRKETDWFKGHPVFRFMFREW